LWANPFFGRGYRWAVGETRWHDSLFAALDIANGHVSAKCFARHRTSESRRFLDEIEANVPQNLDVHLVMDNYATHKTPLIRNWLGKWPHWHVHPTRTSAS